MAWDLGKPNLEFDPYDSNAALDHLRLMNQVQRSVNEHSIRPMRGGLPKWQPGEFDEWKQAKMLHLPTSYGWAAQRRANDKTGVSALIDQGASNVDRVMSGQVGQIDPLTFLMRNR